MVPPVQHAGSVALLKYISQEHGAVQEGGGAERTLFDVRGGKGSGLKVVQRLRAHPQEGTVLQAPGESTIGGG